MRKEERDMETDTSITKDKVTFCIFILVVIWYTLLWMGPVISELYIQQQQHVPIAMKAASMAFRECSERCVNIKELVRM